MIVIKDYFLIKKIKQGDTDAWELLINQYYDSIFSYCVRCCFGNRILAADLTQDIFLKLIENIHKYKFTGKFYNYLFTIAVNTCRNYFTKKSLDECPFEDYNRPLETKTTSETTLLLKEEDSLIQNALNQLNENQREAIILKFYYDFKVKEIAKITDVRVPTAQSRINQGLKKLEKVLDRKEFEDD
ncbi:RNA polymerase sigma factor [Enterococcus sp. LJL99]